MPSSVGLKRAFDLVDVLARLDDADDRGIRARPADAVLFERLDERRLAVAWRRLRELLLRLERAQLEPIAFGQRRQHVGAVVVLGAAASGTRPGGAILSRFLVVDRHPPGELRHRALDAEEILRGFDVDRGLIEGRRRHLRGDEAVPDQAIEVVPDRASDAPALRPGGTASTSDGWLRARPERRPWPRSMFGFSGT